MPILFFCLNIDKSREKIDNRSIFFCLLSAMWLQPVELQCRKRRHVQIEIALEGWRECGFCGILKKIAIKNPSK